MGDMTLDQAFAKVGNRMGLEGNIETHDLMMGTPEILRPKIAAALEAGRGRRFILHENLRIANHRPCNGDALALSAGQFSAAFANNLASLPFLVVALMATASLPQRTWAAIPPPPAMRRT